LTDTGGLLFAPTTGNDAIDVTGGGTSTITIPSVDVTSISVTLGNGTNSFTFTGTGGASAAPTSVNTGSTAADTIAVTGAVIDSGALSLTSGGTISESGSGAISDSAGTVTASSVGGTTLNASNTISTFNATNNTSGNIRLTNTAAPLTITGMAETGGGITVSNTGSIVTSGAITDATAANAISLTATNGSLTLGAAVTGTTTDTMSLTVTGGGNTLAVNAAVTTGSGNINATSAGSITETGGSFGTTGLLTTSSATGTTLGGANTVSSFNATNTTSGNISLTNTAAPLTVTSLTEENGGTVTINNTGAVNFPNTLGGGYNLNDTSTGLTTFSAAVGSPTALASVSVANAAAINGSTVTTTGNQVYSGTVTLGANTIATGANLTFSGTVDSGASSSSLTANATGTTTFGSAVGGANPLTALTVNTNDLSARAIATTTGVTVNNTDLASAITGVISGSGATLIKTGTGTLTLSASPNTYSGLTTVNGGTLTLDGPAQNNQETGTGNILVNSPGILLDLLPNQIDDQSIITLNGGTFNLGNNVSPVSREYIGGLVMQNNALVTSGTPGAWFITAGTNAAPSGTITTAGSGNAGTISANIAIASPFAADGGQTGSRTENFDVASGTTLTVSGSIADFYEGGGVQGSVNVTSGGTLILQGNNTYTGTTTVNNGLLLVNGNDSAATGAVMVDPISGLGGTGTLGGVVTVNAGGFVTGATLGTLGTLTVGGLNFNGGTLAVDINGNNSDEIVSTGPVNLADPTQGIFSINSHVGTPSANNVYTLIDNTSATSISNPPLSGAPEGGTVTINGVTTYVSYSGGNGKSFTLTAAGNPIFNVNGTLTVRKDTTNGASNIQLLQGGIVVDERPLASITSVYTINSSAGATDSLTVDYTNSPPVPAGLFPTNITYNETGPSPASLTVKNGTFGKIAYNPSSTTNETIQDFTNPGDIAPVTTITANDVSTISDTSTNTGIAIANLPNLLPGTGSTTFGTAGGVSQFAGNITPTTGFGDPATNLVVNMGARGTLTFNAMDGSFNPSNGVQVRGSNGNDTFNVNWIASHSTTINGNGGTDTVNVNTGKTAGDPGFGTAGAVFLTDPGGAQTYLANVSGVGSDTMDVNDQNQSATSPPAAPSGAPTTGIPAITTATGPATVASNGVKVLDYSGTAHLTTLDLLESTGTNTYNVQYPDSSVVGSKLPIVNIQTSTTTDTANLYGTAAGGSTFDVGFTTAGTTSEGGAMVTYPEGATYLNTLNIYGRDKVAGDTFRAYPDAHTLVNINAGLPSVGTGDTLILNAFGLTNPAIVPLYNNTARPNGEVTSSNKATLLWNSIETFPVPLGLGGTFQFKPVTSALQPGFLPVSPSDNPITGLYAPADDGWTNVGAGAFDRSKTPVAPSWVPNAPGVVNLLQSGEWGYAGMANDGVFQVSVAPNQNIQITTIMGDTYQARQNINVFVQVPGQPATRTALNPTSTTFDTIYQKYQYVSYSGVFNPGNSNLLDVIFETNMPANYWTVSMLDVRPLGLIAPLTLTRVDTQPPTTPQLADGLTIDQYVGSGASPNAILTINPQYGTPVTSSGGTIGHDPALKGFQVQADANGNFTFYILRPTGNGTSLVTVGDVTGESAVGQVGPTGAGSLAVSPNPWLLPLPYDQQFQLPTVRQIKFGATGTPTPGPTYLLFGNATYTSTAANALGWIGTQPQPYDRGASYGSNLQRDGVLGSYTAPGEFEIDMPGLTTTYSVTVLLGDAEYNETNMYVQVYNQSTGLFQTVMSGINTPAGDSSSCTFPVTTNASGQILLKFGSTYPHWDVQDIEVRPETGTSPPAVGTQISLSLDGTTYTGTSSGTGSPYSATVLPAAVQADGSTSTVYTITGAVPGSLLTVKTSLGTLLTADQGPTFLYTQVLANGTGQATFSIMSPLSSNNTSGTITVTDVTGASQGVFTQNYSGFIPSPALRQFQFTYTGSPQYSTFTMVPNATLYTATRGYGWQSIVGGYNRGAASVVGVNAGTLFQSGAWGSSSGTFEVTVPKNSTDDVRVYVGDPYSDWAGISVSVDGGPAVSVDPTVDQFGYVTVYGTTDPGTGILNIKINGPVWVVAGLQVAPTGQLPAPATGSATTLSGVDRLEFSSNPIGGFTSVSNSATYTQTTGYGWTSPVYSFSRPNSQFPVGSGLTATQMQFYGSGAWGTSKSTFEVAVPLNSPSSTYSARIYIADPYATWAGITVTGEGAAPVTVSSSISSPQYITLTGLQDLNGDGIITITVSANIWVLNGIDIAPSSSPLPPPV